MKKKVLTIFTIGHSTRSIEEFLSILKHYHITEVVDIRTIPKSKHNPQFNGDALAHVLRNHHIGYRHQANLGGLRHTTKKSINTAWENSSFRGYADYMQTDEFKAGIEQLIEIAQHKIVVIMCAEAVPWRCHRSLIGDALLIRGVKVKDIYSTTSVKPHKLTPWAAVHGMVITYPAKEPLKKGLNVAKEFKVGDHVSWNSEAGRVRGIIKKKISSEITFKGYKVHASRQEPQYLIKSDKTDHMAMHKGSALRKIKKIKTKKAN